MRRASRTRPVLAVAAGAVVSTTCLRALDSSPLFRRGRWQRQNFRGRTVSLVGGPALAAGLIAGSATAAAAWPAGVAGAAAASLGLYDDLAGDSHARGLRGHARAAMAGQLTTGLVKLTGLVAGGVVAAAMRGPRGGRARPVVVAVDALLIAGMANLMNLLDLRPGRAGKAALIIGVPVSIAGGCGNAAAGAVVGATLAVIRADLAESVMLGDCGANAAGAVLGAAMCASFGPAGRAVALGAVTAATLSSESVSFSDVIEHTPWLAAIDALGRRP